MYILIIIITYIISTTPAAANYELSIYGAFPIYLWILIAFTTIMGQIILLNNFLAVKDKSWIFASIGLLIINFILISMPLIRKYEIYGRHDILMFVGYMKDIIFNGHFGESLIYPIGPILGFSISSISGIEIELIPSIIPPIFYMFFLISFIVLFRYLFKKEDKVILGLIIAFTPIYIVTLSLFAPNWQTIALLPFYLFMFLKSRSSINKIGYRILTVILSIFLVFYHPIVSLIVILILLLMHFSSIIHQKFFNEKIEKIRIKGVPNLILIMLVSFFSWGAYIYLFVKNFQKIYDWIIGESLSQAQEQTLNLINASPEINDLFVLIYNIYGIWILLGIISIVCIFYLLKAHNINELNYYQIFSSFSFLALSVSAFLIFIAVSWFSFMRIYQIAIIFSIILIPTCLYEYMNFKKNKKGIKIVLAIIIIILSTSSIFNGFPSSRAQLDNHQVSSSEIIGMESFFNNRNKDVKIVEWGISKSRFYEYIYGYDTPEKKFTYYEGDAKNPIDHFGYQNDTNLPNYYNESLYFLLSSQGINHYIYRYQGKYQHLWRFNKEDFVKLNNQNGVDIVYSNGDLKIYFIT